ncbi:MAG: hypothetical protein PHV12_00280 [Bacteroidales bacterium]|jgi:Spy/CpxP family protein refolding chaperone|nr:hypothetical protein [Bacteroidales bacterium]MDD3272744.1 hypothetical protein [Bacteroidales bacterium]MDD4058127.1 hypothetical protein [Bacteroidales bacterium]
MKKVSTLLVMTVIALTMSAQGQNMNVKRQNAGYMRANPEMVAQNLIPDLTPDQLEKIQSLRVQHQKESLLLANEIREKRAQLRTMEQVDKPNLKAVNSKIDEITTLQNKKYKMNAEHRSKVRSLLTDEQRVQYDLRNRRDNYRQGRKGAGMYGDGGTRQFRNR